MRFPRLSSSIVLMGGMLLVALSAGSAAAQSIGELRGRYLLPELNIATPVPNVSDRSTPGSNAGSPSAFGPNWGDVFVGTGFAVNRYSGDEDFRDRIDGSVVAGFGIGDANEYVGLEVDVISLSTFDSGFGNRMSYGFKAHRILPGSLGIAIGVENAFTTGDGIDGADRTFYAVGTKVFTLGDSARDPFSAITVTLGAGNGRFRTEDDVFADEDTINPFASVGIRVLEPVSLIADWTGQDLILAASLVPFRSFPLVITPGVADVTGTAGDGARFMLGAGLGFSFAPLLNP